MGECQPLDESLSHVPDVEARRIVRTALGIEKSRSPQQGAPARSVGEEKLLLPVVGSVAPGLPGEVAAEEAPYLFSSRVPAVEKSSRGEVVELAVYVELPVRDYLLVRVVLKVTQASKDGSRRAVFFSKHGVLSDSVW